MNIFVLIEGDFIGDCGTEPIKAFHFKEDAEKYASWKKSQQKDCSGEYDGRVVKWIENSCGDFEIKEIELI